MADDGFDDRLRAARAKAGLDRAERDRLAPARSDPHPLTLAARLGAEMIGALLVAGAIGWGLDRWLGTRPWLMVAFLPIGIGAGLMNLLRAANPDRARSPTGRGKGWGT